MTGILCDLSALNQTNKMKEDDKRRATGTCSSAGEMIPEHISNPPPVNESERIKPMGTEATAPYTPVLIRRCISSVIRLIGRRSADRAALLMVDITARQRPDAARAPLKTLVCEFQ